MKVTIAALRNLIREAVIQFPASDKTVTKDSHDRNALSNILVVEDDLHRGIRFHIIIDAVDFHRFRPYEFIQKHKQTNRNSSKVVVNLADYLTGRQGKAFEDYFSDFASISSNARQRIFRQILEQVAYEFDIHFAATDDDMTFADIDDFIDSAFYPEGPAFEKWNDNI